MKGKSSTKMSRSISNMKKMDNIVCEGQNANKLAKTLMDKTQLPYGDSHTNLSLGEFNKDFTGILSKSSNHIKNDIHQIAIVQLNP